MFLVLAVMVSVLFATAPAAGIDPGLVTRAQANGSVPVLIVLPDRGVPALAPLRTDADPLARRRALVEALRARADGEQALVRAWLDRRGIAHRDYWIASVIAARLSAAQITQLAARGDVARVASNQRFRALPRPPAQHHLRSQALLSRPWGLSTIRANVAWEHGVTGQGAVVAGEDTGYQWDHPALKAQYRGWNGVSADHDYNWHDAIHTDQHGSSCGVDSPAPCDDQDHGTHTMGTMVGDDGGANEIGVAPGARWIGCRNMDAGWGTPARYIECMQWMLAPTDMAGNNPDPGKSPDVINNSWYCAPSEGCTTGEEIRIAVDNIIAGGIFYAAAAGNDGPSCYSIKFAPGRFEESFSVAATDSSNALTGFSSRGPSLYATQVYLDLAAPGENVRSSIPTDTYGSMSGTSMATPHVAGTVALMISVNPALRGHPVRIAQILRATAARQGITDPYNSSCGGLTLADWPNYQAGYGRLDAWAAVRMADTIFADGFEP